MRSSFLITLLRSRLPRVALGPGLLSHSLAPPGCPLLSFLFSDFVLCLSFAQVRCHVFSYLTLAVLVLWLLVFFGLVLFPVSSWLSFFVFCLRSSDVDLCLSFALLRFFWSFPLALAGLAMGFLLVFLFFLFVFSSSSSALTPGDCFASVFVFSFVTTRSLPG